MDYKQYILELLAPVGEALKLDDPYPTLTISKREKSKKLYKR